MKQRLPSDPGERTRVVVEACLALGFARAGVAKPEPSAQDEEFRAWLDTGGHGQMGYMAERVETRLDVRRMLDGARSVIVVADQYAARGAGESDAAERVGAALPATARIAKYARGRDYHKVVKDRLHALADRLRESERGCECVSFVDTGPVLEREHAARACLGGEDGPGAFIGKHTLLIDPRLGSYFVLGGIVTNLELTPTGPRPGAAVDHCGTCTRCIDACPTGAIKPYAVEATRCISYLTLEHEGPIEASLHPAMGSWIAGCDVCQDVCPFNTAPISRGAGEGRVHASYAPSEARERLAIVEVVRWGEAERRSILSGSAAKRANLSMLRRNALIALSNVPGAAGDAQVGDLVNRIASDPTEDATVRTTARQVLDRWGAGV